ncbi:MAG: RlmE family RNA methyltransferase [Planctomycetota bacterium]
MPRPRQLHDEYFRRAKADGYLARSAYKLIEIDDKKRILRKGSWVLDLGCAPGSWLQVISERVGGDGRVVGIDLQRVRHPMPQNVRTLEGDIRETTHLELIDFVGGRYHAVLSDMAPATSGGGGGSGDHFLSIRLAHEVVDIAERVLRPRGAVVIKVFDGEAFPELLDRARSIFGLVTAVKPKATRDLSRELYLVAQGYKPGKKKPKTSGAPPPEESPSKVAPSEEPPGEASA